MDSETTVRPVRESTSRAIPWIIFPVPAISGHERYGNTVKIRQGIGTGMMTRDEVKRAGMGHLGDSHEGNRRRLVLLQELFGISTADIARQIGLSRAYVSGVLNGHAGLNPEAVFSRVEVKLPQIVSRRQRNLFSTVGADVSLVESLYEESQKVAA